MTSEHFPKPSYEAANALGIKRIAREMADKIHAGINSGAPIISVEMPQPDGVIGITTYAIEHNMIPDHSFNRMAPIEMREDTNIGPVSLYIGNDVVSKTRDTVSQLYAALNRDDKQGMRQYTIAQDTLMSLRNYVSIRERGIHSLLNEQNAPDYPADDLENRIVQELAGTPFEAPKRNLLQRLRPGSDTTSPKAIKSIARLHSDQLPGLTVDVTRTRAWIDMHLVNNTNNVTIDTLKQINHYQLTTPPRGARILGQKSLEALQHGIDASKEYLSHTVNDALGIERLDKTLFNFHSSLNSIETSGLPDAIAQRIIDTRTQLLAGIALRGQALEYPLYNLPSSYLRYEPTHMHEMAGALATPAPTPRETIEVKPQQPAVDHEALTKQRSEERAARLEARRNSELQAAEELAAANERDLPKLTALNQLIADYNELLAPFYAQSGKQLRAAGITGNSSLEFVIRKNTKDDFDDGRLLNKLRVYHGLTQLMEQHASNDHILATINQADALAEQHAALLESTVLEGAVKPDVLRTFIRSDLTWLSEHWSQIRAAILLSNHNRHSKDYTLDRIAQLLDITQEREGGLEPDSSPEADSRTPESTHDDIPEHDVTALHEEPLVDPDRYIDVDNEALAPSLESQAMEQLNKQAEQLDWVVLPTDTITPEDIIQIAHKALRDSGNKQQNGIDRNRVTSLLDFRNLYGGELFRSAERTLGDSNNLYFVLKFTHPEDEKVYAIAENVVFGNATYIIREDTMPLEPGESVLTAVTLSRKDARELGARRIIHTSNPTISHKDKITSAITELSRKQSLI